MDLLELRLMSVAGLSGMAGLAVLLGIALSTMVEHWRSHDQAPPRATTGRYRSRGEQPDLARTLLLRQARWRGLV